jgi:hypothetical protein
MSSRGIGGVRFGLTESRAVAELSRVFGRPSRRFANSGCGARYTEVSWGHLYAEFRLGSFSGFRYLAGGWLRSGPGNVPSSSKRMFPRLVTAKSITLGSTLGSLRAAYRRLDAVGTDRWRTADGLVFYDNAEHDPAPASSRILEIKFGTCGDF